MRASLIVLNYNGATVLEQCLASILAAMSDDDELIVVDNASSDGSDSIAAAFCSRHGQIFVPRTENNYIFGLNDGLAAASGKYVGFLNNDNEFTDATLEQIVQCFDRDSVFAVCPRILQRRDGTDQGALTSGFWSRGLIFYGVHPHDPHARNTFFAVGGQSVFDREKLYRIGTIDAALYPMYHEDIELSWRAWKAGYEIRYAPDATVVHVGGYSSSRAFTPGQLRAFVRQNEYLTVWKNITDRRLLAEHLVLLPARLAVAAANRDWPTLQGFAVALTRLPRAMRARRLTRRTAVLSDRDVLRRVSAHALGISQ